MPPAELVDEIFAEAIELPESDRAQYVHGRCAGDQELESEVSRLLSAHAAPGEFLEPGSLHPAQGQRPRLIGNCSAGDLIAGTFEIRELLGGGGMGEVYLAFDRTSHEEVALKFIREEWASDQATLVRLRREARIRGIAHPNICPVFWLHTTRHQDQDVVFLSMKYLKGETLAQSLRAAGPRSFDQALSILSGVAAGLDAAHRQGIVHRDLKPSNIMLVPGQFGTLTPILMDFGLVQEGDLPDSAAVSAGEASVAGTLVGSPWYMAPEQFLSATVQPSADIFALGVIAFEMVSGQRPFPDEGLLQAAARRQRGAPRSLSTLLPQAPASWCRTIESALDQDPNRRPATALEFVEQLQPHWHLPKLSRRALVGLGISALAVSTYELISRFISERPNQSSHSAIMLTPVAFSGSDTSELAQAAQVANVLLRVQLTQSAFLNPLDSKQVASAWQRMRTKSDPRDLPLLYPAEVARQLALRSRCRLVLYESLTQTGDSIYLRLILERLAASVTSNAGSKHEDFEFHSVLELHEVIDRAARWIRVTAGESRDSLDRHSISAQDLTTPNWEALKEYAEGDEAWRNPAATALPNHHAEAALLHLKRAVEIDPAFASAAARLADIQMASGDVEDALGNYGKAVSAINNRNLTDRESLRTIGLFALDGGRFHEAEEIFARYSLEYPEDSLPLFYKAGAAEAQGRPEEALNLLSLAQAKDPESYSYPLNRAITLLKLGRLPEAERACEESSRLRSEDWCTLVRAALAFSELDMPRVTASLKRLKASGSLPFQSRSFLFNACLSSEARKWPEAEQFINAGLEFDATNGLPAEHKTAKLTALGAIYRMSNRTDEVAQVCQKLIADYPGFLVSCDAAALLAQSGRLGEAIKCLPNERGLSSQVKDWPEYRYAWNRARAEVALAQGNASRAFALMKDVRAPSLLSRWPGTLYRAALRSGELKRADLELTRLTSAPGAYWLAADLSGPGFMREALEAAPQLSFRDQTGKLVRFLNQG